MIYGENPQKDREHACLHKNCTQPDCPWMALWDKMQFEERMSLLARLLPGGRG